MNPHNRRTFDKTAAHAAEKKERATIRQEKEDSEKRSRYPSSRECVRAYVCVCVCMCVCV